MAFNTTSSAEKRVVVNSNFLSFTQPYTASDLTRSTFREPASSMRRGQLGSDLFGNVYGSTDKEGHLRCDNNRRMFSVAEACVDSVPVVFDGTRRPSNSSKSKLNDPTFIPRIRGEASRIQIPEPLTSGQNAYQMQNETSLLGSVSAGYSKRQLYNSHQYHEVHYEYSYSSEEESALKDKYSYEDEDELEFRFTQLDIKSTFSDPIHRELVSLKEWGERKPDVFGDPTVHRDKGVKWCNNNRHLYAHKEAEDDCLPVNFYGNRRRTNAVECKRNDQAFIPRTRGGTFGFHRMNPKDLRFTQLDIKSIFSDPAYPTLRESVSLIRRGELDPAVYSELTVHRDEQGVVWCESNRRLYVLRMAGVSSVRVKFISNAFKFQLLKEEDKNKMKDPAFMPRIRGASGVQISPPPTSGPSFYQEQNETSLVGSVSAGYWVWKLYNQDHHHD